MAKENRSERREDEAAQNKRKANPSGGKQKEAPDKEHKEAAGEGTTSEEQKNAAQGDKDPHRGITGNPVRPTREPTAESKDKKTEKEEQPSSGKAGEQAAPGKEKNEPREDKDPHRGTAETLSQHRNLDPDGERNNDENADEGHAPGEKAEAKPGKNRRSDPEKE